MARVVTKVGDVFQVNLGNARKGFFQYVANDLTQLNSDVIRIFSKTYEMDENPHMEEIVSEKVSFYAHAVTSLGVKLGYWEKVGKSSNVGQPTQILFRGTNDYGHSPNKTPILVSQKWYVWRIGEEFRVVGNLTGENRNAEIGVVFDPNSIVERMKTGKYPGFYPDFE